jgi:hypothetical protein
MIQGWLEEFFKTMERFHYMAAAPFDLSGL